MALGSLFAPGAPLGAEPAAEAATAPEFRAPLDPESEWVLQLRLAGRVLAEGLLAFETSEGEILLPLDALAAAFEFVVHADPQQARAEGWLIHPERAFVLDLVRAEVRVDGASRSVASEPIRIAETELYVSPRLLSAWWPVDLAVDRRTLRIEALPREMLPVEKRLARERLHARLGLRGGDSGAGLQPEHAWWNPPAVDVNLGSRVLRPTLGGAHEFESQYDIATAGDLFKLRTETLLSGVAGKYSRLRARAGRRDLEGRMGGPLRLREVMLGDVTTPSLGQLSQARAGRGLQLSSFPLDHQTELAQLTLEGDLRPDWSVELYRDDVLLDFRDSNAGLRYRFEDVPTVPGLNVFVLVFRGPRGETREEERRIWMDGGLADAGETRYRLTFNQHDEDLFHTGDLGGRESLRGEARGVAELEHGFGEDFTLALAGATLPLEAGRRSYASLGARGRLAGSLVRLNALGDHTGGWAAGGGWQTRLGRVSLGLSHHEYRSFLSERTRTLGGETLLGRSEAHVDGGVPDFVQPFQYRVALGASRLADGRLDGDGLLRLSTWLRPVWLTHTLRGHLNRGDGSDGHFVDGELIGSFHQGPFGLRGRFAYGADPGEPRSVSLLGDWTPLPLTTTRLGVTHAFGDRTSLVAGLSRQLGALVLSAHVEVDEDGLAQAGVGVSFGLAPSPWSPLPRATGPGATSSGSVGARAFLDRNANGYFDEEDAPLPEVGFLARGSAHERTGADGTVLLTGLPIDSPLEIGLDAGTLEDPHWIAPRDDARMVLRPGARVQLDFPVVPVGEVDGFVRRRDGEATSPLAGIAVQLVDAAGEVVASARSEIDGFFLFQEVIAGSYRLRVDPEQAARLGLAAPAERALRIEGAGSLVSGADLELRRR